MLKLSGWRWVIIDSGNDLAPVLCQAIAWNNDDM